MQVLWLSPLRVKGNRQGASMPSLSSAKVFKNCPSKKTLFINFDVFSFLVRKLVKFLNHISLFQLSLVVAIFYTGYIYWISLEAYFWVDDWHSVAISGLDRPVHQLPLSSEGVELQDVIKVGGTVTTAWIFISKSLQSNCSSQFISVNNLFSRVQTVVSYLSSEPFCLCWPHSGQSEEMAALQYRPRLTQSPPAAQLRIAGFCQTQSSHQRQGKSEI